MEKKTLNYLAQRGETITPSPFFHAIKSGLRSMHPPVAKPAQPVATGAMMDSARSNGAAVASGMAILKVTLLVGSVHTYWPWTEAAATKAAPARLNIFMVIAACNNPRQLQKWADQGFKVGQVWIAISVYGGQMGERGVVLRRGWGFYRTRGPFMYYSSSALQHIGIPVEYTTDVAISYYWRTYKFRVSRCHS